MSALYNALLEGETKEKLALMVCELREENARLREIVRGFLDCPEIAYCAPEDMDPETYELERQARAALPEETTGRATEP